MKDNVYWCIFRRLKKKYPIWNKIQIGTVAYKMRYCDNRLGCHNCGVKMEYGDESK